MLMKIISYVPAVIGLFTIAYFVLSNNSREIKNKVFATLNICASLWLLSLFIADTTDSSSIALIALRAGLFFGQMMFLFFFYFALLFPSPIRIDKKLIYLLSVPIVVSAFLLLTPLGVETVTIHSFGVQPEQTGFLYTFSDLFGLAYLLTGIFILLKKYKSSDSQEKKQIKFVLSGILIATVINVATGLLLPLLEVETEFILFGGFSIFLFSLFVAYAMVKHGFFEIRTLLVRSLAYALSIGTLLLGFIVISLLVSRGLLELNTEFGQQIYYISLSLVLALVFQPVKRYFDKVSSKI